MAFSAEGATAFVRKGDPETQAVTVETALASMRQFLQARVAWWG